MLNGVMFKDSSEGKAFPGERWIELASVALVFLAGLLFYLWVLLREPLIYGVDGPYYLIQVEALLDGEGLAYADPPLAFFIFAGFAKALGDVTLGIKVATALFSALSAIPLYLLVRRVSGSLVGGLAAMVAGLFSVQHLRLMGDLLKNAVGVLFLLAFVYFLHETVFAESKRRSALFSTVFLALAALTHVLDFGVAVLFLLFYSLLSLLLKVEVRELLRRVGPIYIGLAAFLAVGIVVFWPYFSDLTKGIGFLQDLLSDSQQPNPLPFFLEPGAALMAPVLLVGLLLAAHEGLRERVGSSVFLGSAVVVGVLISLPVIPKEWLWRFALMGFVPMSIVIGCSVGKVRPRLSALLMMILVLSPLTIQAVGGSEFVRPTITEDMYDELLEMKELVVPGSAMLTRTRRVAGLFYWTEYLLDVDRPDGPLPELFQRYDHIYSLTEADDPTPLPPRARILYQGDHFLLAEL
ncbi:MAG: 6-pyruvoyl-tetrahydropterin synthase-related protein [Candidatus Geothermarchaeales archaeon]